MAHLGGAKVNNVARLEHGHTTNTQYEADEGDVWCGGGDERNALTRQPSPGRSGHVNPEYLCVNGLRSCLCSLTFADEEKVQAGGVLHNRTGQAG